MFDSVFGELRSAGHSDVVDHFLVRVTDALEVRHRNPQGLFTEIARAFSGEKTATIAMAAEVVITDRAVLMAPKNATEALAKAKQLQLEAKAYRTVGITITKSGNPQQWAAWCRAANAEPQRYATIRKIIDLATECIVPTAWPPSAGS